MIEEQVLTVEKIKAAMKVLDDNQCVRPYFMWCQHCLREIVVNEAAMHRHIMAACKGDH